VRPSVQIPFLSKEKKKKENMTNLTEFISGQNKNYQNIKYALLILL
jgi:hypothetical protein